MMRVTDAWDAVRRRVMRSAVHSLFRVAPSMSDVWLERLGRMVGSLAAGSGWLRRRLRSNLQQAFASEDRFDAEIDNYLRRFGCLAEFQTKISARGLDRIDLSQWQSLGESVHHLDDAVALGRGVVLCSPHLFGYEIAAGVIARRHRLVVLMRESAEPARQALKERWYRSLGVEAVRRPRRASPVADLETCLDILRQGAILAITPDLLVGSDEGVPVQIFGRTAHLKPGAAALAMYSQAPLVMGWSRETSYWRRESQFSEPRFVQRTGSRRDGGISVSQCLQQEMQGWASELETYLRGNIAEWMFWLDKRWSRLLQSPRTQEPSR